MASSMEDTADKPDFKAVPIRAMNISSRIQLSQYLNPEQVIMTASGLARDYRGLAELMGFSYSEVKNYQRNNDPMRSLLEAFETMGTKVKENTLQDLLNMLEEIERFDVVDDILPALANDARNHQKRKCAQSDNIDKQSSPSLNHVYPTPSFAPDSPSHLTVDDAMNPDQLTKYDAYVCYADADYEFVKCLSSYLESEQLGLKLFIRERDLLLGKMQLEVFTHLIQSRCNRVLTILTPEFLESNECKHQSIFAASVGVDTCTRKLIPIIYRNCSLPNEVKYLSKIDLTKGAPEWTWRKLVASIRGNEMSPKAMFLPPPKELLAISGPSSTCFIKSGLDSLSRCPPPPTAPPQSLTNTSITEILDSLPVYSSDVPSSSASKGRASSASTVSSNSASSLSKPVRLSWMKSIKQKIAGSNNSSAAAYAQLNSSYQLLEK